MRKVDFARLLVGVIASWRYWKIVADGIHYLDPAGSVLGPGVHPQTVVGIGILVLLGMFTVGLFTPLASIGLLASLAWADRMFLTSTLGTNVLLLLITFFVVVGAGRTYSLDSWLSGRAPGAVVAVIRAPYRLLGPASRERLAASFLLLFVAFALLNFAAFTFHAADSYWQQGRTVEMLATNSYMSRWWEPLRSFQAWQPGLMHAVSAIAGVLHSIWQVLMIPLVFWRWAYRFVVIYGGVFILVSLAMLQLSYLPHVEAALWVIVFSPVPARRPLTVFYDDYCNLCKGAVSTLNAFDPFARYDFRPLSRNQALIEQHGLTVDMVQEDIHGVDWGGVYRGYDLYARAALRNPVLWWLWFFLMLGRIGSVGPRTYRVIAARRRRLFGTCLTSYAPPRQDTLMGGVGDRGIGPVLVSTWALVLVLFVILLDPVVKGPRAIGAPVERLSNDFTRETFSLLGLRPPSVFNESDLRLGDVWAVLYRVEDRTRELVPFAGQRGERLQYHRGDRLYFGNGLVWRRSMAALEEPTVDEGTRNWCRLVRVALFDARKRGSVGVARYQVEIWTTHASDLDVPLSERYVRSRVQTFSLLVEPDEAIPERCGPRV